VLNAQNIEYFIESAGRAFLTKFISILLLFYVTVVVHCDWKCSRICMKLFCGRFATSHNVF
jgi:hypothetical protein